MSNSQQKRKKYKIFSIIIDFFKRNIYFSRFIDFILNNSLYKSALILGSGTTIAQIIGIISMPLITRLYNPSEIGILAIYSSTLAILGIGATLRYEFAYPIPKKEDEALNLFVLSLILLFLTTIIISFILFFGWDLFVNTFNLFPMEPYRWLLIIGFFGTGLYTILNYWTIRQRDYMSISYTKINQSISGSTCKIFLGVISFGPSGLIIGSIISEVAGIGTLASNMWKKEKNEFNNISFNDIKKISKEYIHFPLFNLPASIVNSISLQLPPLVLLYIYDSRTVGFYALASTLLVTSGSVISGSLGNAYLGEASKILREGLFELKSLYLQTIKHLSIIAFLIIGIPALFAPVIIPIIFGEQWIEAGWYCWPLSFTVLMGFVISPTTKLTLYGYNHWMLIWDMIRIILVITGFYISAILGLSIIFTLLIYSLIMSFMYIILFVLNIRAMDILMKKGSLM